MKKAKKVALILSAVLMMFSETAISPAILIIVTILWLLLLIVDIDVIPEEIM
jgi:hypothetical protein